MIFWVSLTLPQRCHRLLVRHLRRHNPLRPPLHQALTLVFLLLPLLPAATLFRDAGFFTRFLLPAVSAEVAAGKENREVVKNVRRAMGAPIAWLLRLGRLKLAYNIDFDRVCTRNSERSNGKRVMNAVIVVGDGRCQVVHFPVFLLSRLFMSRLRIYL